MRKIFINMSKTPDTTIMIVDDDPKIVKALELRLNFAGYKTMSTYNGMTALALARGKKPDLIITDMWMPTGTGLSMAFRMNQLFPGIPLIFLTASKQPGLKEKAAGLGAVGFLEKPYEPGLLLEMVSQFLKPGEQRDEEELEALNLTPAIAN